MPRLLTTRNGTQPFPSSGITESLFISNHRRWNNVPTPGKIRSTRCTVGNFSRVWRPGSHLSKCHTWMHFSPANNLKDIAQRLGISAKAASARMRRFKAKLADLYAALRKDYGIIPIQE